MNTAFHHWIPQSAPFPALSRFPASGRGLSSPSPPYSAFSCTSTCTASWMLWSISLKYSLTRRPPAEPPAEPPAPGSGSGGSTHVRPGWAGPAGGGRRAPAPSVSSPCGRTGILMDFSAYRSCSRMKLLTRLISAT